MSHSARSEDVVAKAVEDRAIVVDFNRLNDVWVVANDHICASIDPGFIAGLEVSIRDVNVFFTCVNGDDDDIDLGVDLFDAFDEAFRPELGDVFAFGEACGEEGNAEVLAWWSKDGGLFCFFDRSACASPPCFDVAFFGVVFEVCERVIDASLISVSDVIIGEAKEVEADIKVPSKTFWMRSEGVFFACAGFEFADGVLEVHGHEIAAIKQVLCGGERLGFELHGGFNPLFGGLGDIADGDDDQILASALFFGCGEEVKGVHDGGRERGQKFVGDSV